MWIRQILMRLYKQLSVLKGWFPYDRRSQIAGLRSSAIIWKLLLRSSAIRDHMETSHGSRSAIVCDHFRSQTIADLIAICDPRSGNQPLDRTWFYLLRSSAITIADLIAICDPRSYGNQPLDSTYKNRFSIEQYNFKKLFCSQF